MLKQEMHVKERKNELVWHQKAAGVCTWDTLCTSQIVKGQD